MSKPYIAFVDDETDLTEAYQELFEHKYTIKTFPSAEHYLAHVRELKKNPFKITVTDFKMEALNGIEMINIAIDEKINCPFILLSGHIDQENLAELVHDGALVTLLEKPPDLKQLDQMIEKMLNSQIRSA